MIDSKSKFDVFLSHSMADRAAAEQVRRSLELAGLYVFDPSRLELGVKWSDAIWNALAKSDAIVVILSRDSEVNPNVAAEIGAALAWAKPIFPVSQANGATRVPTLLAGLVVYPLARIDDVARAIQGGPVPLSDEQRDALRSVYVEMNMPTDKYLTDPDLLDQLAVRFRKETGAGVPAERLVYEMLRLRKRGNWPRLSAPAKRSQSR